MHLSHTVTQPDQRIKRWLLTCNYAPAGDSKLSDNLGWNALPVELEELVLSKLPLVDLARASATHSSFQSALRNELAREQKARCDAALDCVGRQWMSRITSLINCFLKGQALDLDMGRNSGIAGWIMQGGAFQMDRQAFSLPANESSPTGHCRVRVSFTRVLLGSARIHFHVYVRGMSDVHICLDGQKPAGSYINVDLKSHVGREELGLVQLLLSGELAPNWQDGAPPGVYFFGESCAGNFNQAKMVAQIAPMMPFVSQYTFLTPWMTGKCPIPKHCHIGPGGSAGVKRFHLRYFLW
jgi:hypothetical protein